jgi:hypothetical protein
MLELGEHLLDGIEIGRVSGQEDEVCAGFADSGSHALAFVTAQIVHDHYVCRPKRRNQNRFDVEQKAFGIDGSIDEPRRIDAVVPQRGEERHGVPMAIRCLGLEAISFGSPAAQGRHVGFGPGLVDEDQAGRINATLVPYPPFAPSADVGTILLGGQQSFF